MNISINKCEIKDKINAYWIGKNIGGTMGVPFEGSREFNNITGYTTKPGEPLPNDDLDLQIAWLIMAEMSGAKSLDANMLSHAWQMMVTPHWNEYGVSKKNLSIGLLPPLSGEYQNELWRNSNGAWIRSEIWACLSPGIPNIAVKYGVMDASVDHGIGEGTYAAMFTAALESYAFTCSDIRKNIENALGYIPENSRVSQTINRVIKEYDNKTDYQKVRNIVVDMNKDLGWFQAPGNVGFVTIGLLYGEGDFKKSMIYTINCGDDTDCTAGTVGSVLGIMYGTKGIPSDWREYIGDRIVQACINTQYQKYVPCSCMELTERVMKFMPELLGVNGVSVEYTDGETQIDADAAMTVCDEFVPDYFTRKKYSFDINEHHFMTARVEYDKVPEVTPYEEFEITVKFRQITDEEPINAEINVVLPDGWTAQYKKYVHIAKTRDILECSMPFDCKLPLVYTEFKIKVNPGENIRAVNKLYINVERNRYIVPFVIPVTLLG